MKKIFEMPKVNIITLEANDILCTSGCSTPCPEYGTGSVLEPTQG